MLNMPTVTTKDEPAINMILSHTAICAESRTIKQAIMKITVPAPTRAQPLTVVFMQRRYMSAAGRRLIALLSAATNFTCSRFPLSVKNLIFAALLVID
jgi:hypothetical protein